MSVRAFLDTNVIVYSFDNRDPRKQEKALSILNMFFTQDCYYISTQIVQEFCNVALTKMHSRMDLSTVREFIGTFPEQRVCDIDMSTIDYALHVKDSFGYSFWDSLVLASAVRAGCSMLYTEDMSHGQVIEGVTIQNPFSSDDL